MDYVDKKYKPGKFGKPPKWINRRIRENGYPYYKTPSGSKDRLTTPHESYSEFPHLVKGSLNPKIQWDGTIKGFKEYKHSIESFYRQQYSGYIFDKKFLKLYCMGGPSHVVGNPTLPRYMHLTVPQIMEASVHLFGAIQGSTKKSNTALKFLQKHDDSQDGILLWYDLINTQDNSGNKEVHSDNHIAFTRKLLTPDHPGGLLGYLEDMADAYAGLDSLGNSIFSPTENAKSVRKS